MGPQAGQVGARLHEAEGVGKLSGNQVHRYSKSYLCISSQLKIKEKTRKLTGLSIFKCL